jgi:acetyl-CoA acetyltransferase
MQGSAAIVAVGQSDYVRRPQPEQSTLVFIRDAVVAALADAALDAREIDGMAVASFSLAPDAAVDLAWKLGLSLRWLLQDTNGGSSAMNMLGHALRAVETGAASVILVAAGDATGLGGYARVAANLNTVTQMHLAPLGHGGPNGVYALVTSRQMKKYGLQKSDYGHLAIAQRAWAAGNPHAVYRAPMTMQDYLAAPLVADPLSRYDCVPVVAGAQAIVVTHPDRSARPRAGAPARASHELQPRQPGRRRPRHRDRDVRRRAVAGGRRRSRGCRRRLDLRRLSRHGAGAARRSRHDRRRRSGPLCAP